MIKRIKNDLELFVSKAMWVIILIITHIMYISKYNYSYCFLLRFAGIPCPFCGMTRACVSILQGDFSYAWQLHPFSYCIYAGVIVFIIVRYVLLAENLKIVKYYCMIMFAGMVVFYVYRMLIYFPDQAPMLYFRGNFLLKVISFLKGM